MNFKLVNVGIADIGLASSPDILADKFRARAWEYACMTRRVAGGSLAYNASRQKRP